MTTLELPGMPDRPDYAAARRPGEPLGMRDELVIVHLARADVETIASLIDAGAAALAHGPMSSGIAAMLTARDACDLAAAVAGAMRDEAERVRRRSYLQRIEAGNVDNPKKERKALLG